MATNTIITCSPCSGDSRKNEHMDTQAFLRRHIAIRSVHSNLCNPSNMRAHPQLAILPIHLVYSMHSHALRDMKRSDDAGCVDVSYRPRHRVVLEIQYRFENQYVEDMGGGGWVGMYFIFWELLKVLRYICQCVEAYVNCRFLQKSLDT